MMYKALRSKQLMIPVIKLLGEMVFVTSLATRDHKLGRIIHFGRGISTAIAKCFDECICMNI